MTHFSVERIAVTEKQLALLASQHCSTAEDRQSSWLKSIDIVHLVFHDSSNERQNEFSEQFLPERRGDRSLARPGIRRIFDEQLKRRHLFS